MREKPKLQPRSRTAEKASYQEASEDDLNLSECTHDSGSESDQPPSRLLDEEVDAGPPALLMDESEKSEDSRTRKTFTAKRRRRPRPSRLPKIKARERRVILFQLATSLLLGNNRMRRLHLVHTMGQIEGLVSKRNINRQYQLGVGLSYSLANYIWEIAGDDNTRLLDDATRASEEQGVSHANLPQKCTPNHSVIPSTTSLPIANSLTIATEVC